MTYCVGFLLEDGLVMASDSRTNAGVDYISSYRKLHVFQPSADRLFLLLAAGNLATTQAILNWINRDLNRARREGSTHLQDGPESLADAPSDHDTPPHADLLTARYLFEAADYIGRLSVAVQKETHSALRQVGASGAASFILGGQIAGQPHGLFQIYAQGNAIMATPETPFLQIGESKYGKPPLDGVGHHRLSLNDAARLCLMSQVITRRSNLTVGPPFEVALYPRDSLAISQQLKLERGAAELDTMVDVWNESQRQALERMPRFPWEEQG
ncbi:20S proteasome subunit A/B [Synechococcus sp. CS-1325]|uniref:20S proteasome subunit A/B n=1 Tax=unclassified Synechococcus TaxID=2626047 RepID=UPI000DB2A71E|nr:MULTISPECIES: 20S proteasome subunit A/B [unclassified Synechococcus]PZV00932.1 MAG: 20S proteasome subunit A/B [Cyanobium sp.]MCT0198143.1 20S proteasome subunit A/B [Synechococcus sp. CS-1325]MCT0211962.1 20S proteasome subunit A/B [Synechococcus sp. CS-1326]MCT0229709.1 20S proteasome subunit A/B [Synechococcus sp. CS-1324]MCT0232374.1 20S proteasome subunit A/B [Synechococcus sp. CS-1327]